MKTARELHAKCWQLTISYWFSREALLAWSLLLAAVSLICGIVFTNLYLNNWQADFYNQLQYYSHFGFVHALANFGIMAGVHILISGYQVFFQMKLQLHWRTWLTNKYLNDWLHNKTYYCMNILPGNTDSPDQRISEDIHCFVSHTLNLFLGLLKQIATLIAFTIVLWHLSGNLSFSVNQIPLTIPGYLIWAALGYSALGTWLTTRVGRPLVALNIAQQRYEADFRYLLVRLRENDESIALSHGERYEKNNLMNTFHKICDSVQKSINVTKNLTWFTTSYSQFSFVFAFILASPRYFNNEIQLGQLFEISGAYWYVHSALSYIVNSFATIAEWRAVLARLSQFTINMRRTQLFLKTEQSLEISYPASNMLSIKCLNLHCPDRKILLQNFSLHLKPTDKLLITGSAGRGKSTLLKTLTGIWPFSQGIIHIPAKQKFMLLPQKPYMPLSTLRDVLIYPGMSTPLSTELLKKTLILCNLSFLTDKLDQINNWERILSLGEQQHLAIARAILHKPDWLLLDEATSALEEVAELQIYNILQKLLPKTALISVGHRGTLKKFHTLKLELDGPGTWRLSSLTDNSYALHS
ncbi:MAG TPA: ABC transporter ATP-binding protein/permease [Negativicutes bacterium]